MEKWVYISSHLSDLRYVVTIPKNILALMLPIDFQGLKPTCAHCAVQRAPWRNTFHSPDGCWPESSARTPPLVRAS